MSMGVGGKGERSDKRGVEEILHNGGLGKNISRQEPGHRGVDRIFNGWGEGFVTQDETMTSVF